MTFRHRFHQVRGTGGTGGTDPEGPEVGILTQNKIEGEAQESWIFGCSASILSCTVISVLQLDFSMGASDNALQNYLRDGKVE